MVRYPTTAAATREGAAVGAGWQAATVPDRPEVPEALAERVAGVLGGFPDCRREPAWTGVRWRVGGATVAHLFGGEDGAFRITFRAHGDELHALEHLGPPYFRAEWGSNVAGMLLDARTDWQELTELLTDSYCLQAPAHLAATVRRPPG